jgi:inward rectifier potassium channel
MEQPSFDPGLTQRYTGKFKRAIDPATGEFTVRRVGTTWRDQNPYLFLISLSWPSFGLLVLGVFVTTNLLFAFIYNLVGIEHLKGADGGTAGMQFLNAFFFSTHTLTTVGYGSIFPVGVLANCVAAVEGLVGVTGFAVITGLVYGRFARPSARIGFSDKMLVTPYQDITSLQFRIINRRSNNLINLHARLLLMTVEPVRGKLQRRYVPLPLERDEVLFFPLPWTIVHPIVPGSPLYAKTAADLEALQAEVLILIRAFDETFGQNVNARRSYTYEEFVWGARFQPAFELDAAGDDLIVEVDKISVCERAPLPDLK